MLAEIGLGALLLAFTAAFFALLTAVGAGLRNRDDWLRSARNAALLTFPLLLCSASALLLALLNGHYQVSYVWSVTDPTTPSFYRFTALWGSQQGSLLFWSLLLSLYCFSAILLSWREHRRLMPGVIAVTMATLAFFLALSLLLENPFERFWLAADGVVLRDVFIPAGARAPDLERLAATANGLNPLLRHFGMIIHPPMLYLGFTGFVIPFAFALAALASGDLSAAWIRATRRWTLLAWMFLGLGLLLGGRWAYDVLGWGGYWGWDPVENAALLPWLTGTAFLHSVLIQEKRGMLRLWNMLLVIFAFSAVLFGTFATRSGLIESVHSFARSEIGFPLFAFWSVMTLVALGLTLWRQRQGLLRDERAFAGLLGRESLFVLNNMVFAALFIAIFWGSFGAPLVSEVLLDAPITLGVDYYQQVTPPLFAILFLLMGLAPLAAWGNSSLRRMGAGLRAPLLLTLPLLALLALAGMRTPEALLAYGLVSMAGVVALAEIIRGARARVHAWGESWPQALRALFSRNRGRYGGYVVHLGVTVIGIGVIGSTLFQAETQRTLARGESLTLQNYELRYEGFNEALAGDGRLLRVAAVTLSREGREIATLRPRIDVFPQQPMTIAGIHSSAENDVYVLLTGHDESGARATFRLTINPLINFVWWGGLLLLAGTLIAAWPGGANVATHRQDSALQEAQA
ncbi:MAG: cytochrome c biogenesis protein CcsA [Anaerolineaceae bacterium]|nr:cytochrome c biogenesis protein CcsA [Anaerolineaceae bacterium]